MEESKKKLLKVYTIGYTGRKLDEIKRAVSERHAMLLDIRFKPWSRNPVYQPKSLGREFAAKYVHIQEFGNENYKTEGLPIKLVDFERGLGVLEGLENMGVEAVVLMCACKDYHTCHRATVAEKLKRQGYQVEEISTDDEKSGAGGKPGGNGNDKPGKPGQPPLFIF